MIISVAKLKTLIQKRMDEGFNFENADGLRKILDQLSNNPIIQDGLKVVDNVEKFKPEMDELYNYIVENNVIIPKHKIKNGMHITMEIRDNIFLGFTHDYVNHVCAGFISCLSSDEYFAKNIECPELGYLDCCEARSKRFHNHQDVMDEMYSVYRYYNW